MRAELLVTPHQEFFQKIPPTGSQISMPRTDLCLSAFRLVQSTKDEPLPMWVPLTECGELTGTEICRGHPLFTFPNVS